MNRYQTLARSLLRRPIVRAGTEERARRMAEEMMAEKLMGEGQ